MKKPFALLAVSVVLAIAAAQGGSSLIASFKAAMNEAKSLDTTYTVQQIGEAPNNYKVQLKKPNLARIETPEKVIVADGKQVTIFDRGEKTYYTQPQNDDLLKSLLTGDELSIWSGFFDADAYKAYNNKNLGTKQRKGETLNAVASTIDSNGNKVVTYYLSPQDNIVRQAQVDLLPNEATRHTTSVILTKTLATNKEISSDAFAFNAPSDAKQITYEEANAAKWLTDFEKAKALAKATNRLILVDFYTDWCHWCKVLDKEVYPKAEFKTAAAKFVLVKIDAEKGAGIGLAQAYNVSAYPMIVFTKADGTEVHRIEGYKPLNEFLTEMKSAQTKAK